MPKLSTNAMRTLKDSYQLARYELHELSDNEFYHFMCGHLNAILYDLRNHPASRPRSQSANQASRIIFHYTSPQNSLAQPSVTNNQVVFPSATQMQNAGNSNLTRQPSHILQIRNEENNPISLIQGSQGSLPSRGNSFLSRRHEENKKQEEYPINSLLAHRNQKTRGEEEYPINSLLYSLYANRISS
jgi:hypothetical protein